MFKAGLSPAKIKAGLTWLSFKSVAPDRIAETLERSSTNKQPVGLPQPNIWVTGSASDKSLVEQRTKFQNVPVENFAPFAATEQSIPLKLEPPLAQQIYAVLDVPMQKVLTDRNADIDQLLADAETQVNGVLGTVG